MLATAVPTGRHVIRLWYMPDRLVIATWLALAALAALLAWALWPVAVRKRRPESEREDMGESFAPVLETAEMACRERTATVRSSEIL